jgi:hypothetical protein
MYAKTPEESEKRMESELVPERPLLVIVYLCSPRLLRWSGGASDVACLLWLWCCVPQKKCGRATACASTTPPPLPLLTRAKRLHTTVVWGWCWGAFLPFSSGVEVVSGRQWLLLSSRNNRTRACWGSNLLNDIEKQGGLSRLH